MQRAFVRVLIRDSLGRILVVAHRGNRGWNLPGGKVEQDESPETAARREVLEETGLLLRSLRLCHEDDFAVGTATWHGYFYEAESHEEQAYNMEPAKLSWVEFVDLPSIRKNSNKGFLVNLLQRWIPANGEPWQMPLNLFSSKSFAGSD